MNFYSLGESFESFRISFALTLKSMFTDPFFMLLSSSSVGFIQMFFYRGDTSLSLLIVVLISFAVMTFLGLAKHVVHGETNARMFLGKTLVQFVIMISVITMGHLASVFFAILFSLVGEIIPPARSLSDASLYFMFAGYAILFTYYFIKSCDLIEQTKPELMPAWFSAPFRNFRKTGDYKDLLDFKQAKK
jgi:hypothetical protein